MMPSKLNRLDRGAGSISTLRQGQAAAGGERGYRRSSGKLPGGPVLGRQRTSAGLSQSYFVKRYHWLRRDPPFCGSTFRILHEPLDKAVHFLFSPRCGGRAESLDAAADYDFGKVNDMRRFAALLMALAMTASLAACGSQEETTPEEETPAAQESQESTVEIPPVEDLTGVDTSAIPGVEDGVLTVGMECAYAPYNWTQMDDSNGAVAISNVPGAYANGYDVMIAKRICEAYGWELEIVSSAWDSLTPAVQAGTMDANIAGQSMTADRMAEVDMAGPYYYATIVCVTTKDSEFANATSIADLAGGSCTAQTGTIWYDSCLPQIEGADIQAPAETAPSMIMSLQTGTVDFICTDMPTAMGAVAKDDNLVILNFSGTDGDFQFATEEERAENVNIGIAVQKGNTQLKDAIDTVLSALNEDQLNALMDQAIAVQPAV